MNRLLGVLLMVLVLYGALLSSDENARSWTNQQTIGARLGFYGVLTLGVGLLIVAGGIDLSLGSVVGLSAVCMALLLDQPLEGKRAWLTAAMLGLGPAGGVALFVWSRVSRFDFGEITLYFYPVVIPLTVPLTALLAWVGFAVTLAGITPPLYLALEGVRLSPWLAAAVIVWVATTIGLFHGLLVTRLGLQPFLVTLCGLFIYRGLARWASSTSVGLPLVGAPEYLEQVSTFRELLVGIHFGLPGQLLLLLLFGLVMGLVLHGTVHGRYLYALGANEEAARYAGINTDRYRLVAYGVCSALAGVGGILLLLDSRSVNATSAGQLLELYAITGAVLGGCSLRGGEGTVPGMLLGAAILPLLRQVCSFVGITNELEYAVIGVALLLGTIADELLQRRARRS